MLLMMGGETPETCWATHKRQVINLWNCCILVVELFDAYDDVRPCERQTNVNKFSTCPLYTVTYSTYHKNVTYGRRSKIQSCSCLVIHLERNILLLHLASCLECQLMFVVAFTREPGLLTWPSQCCVMETQPRRQGVRAKIILKWTLNILFG